MLEHMPVPAGLRLGWETTTAGLVCEREERQRDMERKRAHTTFLFVNQLKAYDLIMISPVI